MHQQSLNLGRSEYHRHKPMMFQVRLENDALIAFITEFIKVVDTEIDIMENQIRQI